MRQGRTGCLLHQLLAGKAELEFHTESALVFDSLLQTSASPRLTSNSWSLFSFHSPSILCVLFSSLPVLVYNAFFLCFCSLTSLCNSSLLSDTTYLSHSDISYLQVFPTSSLLLHQILPLSSWHLSRDNSGSEISLCFPRSIYLEVMLVPLFRYLS